MYLTKIPSRNIVRQEHPFSCGAACALQLLRDAGHWHVSEAEVRERAAFTPELGGIYCKWLVEALNQLQNDYDYRGGTVEPDNHDALFKRAPFIAMLDHHWVIVDGLRSDIVYIRDPAGLPAIDEAVGFEASIERSHFDALWCLGYYQTVYREVRRGIR